VSAEALGVDLATLGASLLLRRGLVRIVAARVGAPALAAWFDRLGARTEELKEAVRAANTRTRLRALKIEVEHLKDLEKMASDWLDVSIPQAERHAKSRPSQYFGRRQ
jgi:hypothetical protein